MTYTHIFVPTQGAPFITKEDPQSVVGGYIEVYNQVPNVQDCLIHGMFLQEGSSHPEDTKAWNSVSNLLKNHKKKITIYVNEEGMMNCCPNMAVIGVNQSYGARPLMGDICITLKTSRCRDIIEELDLKTFENYEAYSVYRNDRNEAEESESE